MITGMKMNKDRLQKLAGIKLDESAVIVQRTAVGHVDNEKHMIRKRLYNLLKYAAELDKMLDQLPDDADFPQWWQAKVVSADKYLSKAKHYLEGELAVPKDADQM